MSKTELTGRNPVRWRRAALDRSVIEEEEEEEEEEEGKKEEILHYDYDHLLIQITIRRN